MPKDLRPVLSTAQCCSSVGWMTRQLSIQNYFLQFDTVRHPLTDRQEVDTQSHAYMPPPSAENWKPYFENPLSMTCSLKLTRPLDRVRNLYRSIFSAIKSGDFN